jgi:hypothetical protein
LIHAPTWIMSNTSPLLTRIFHACGAMLMNTAEAATFVDMTLSSATAEIVQIFSTLQEGNLFPDTSDPVSDVPRYHVDLIVGLVLLQTIYVLRGGGQGLVSLNLGHHGRLLWVSLSSSQQILYNSVSQMIRQTRLIERVASWRPPPHTGPVALQSTWVQWAQFETLKRRGIIPSNNAES